MARTWYCALIRDLEKAKDIATRLGEHGLVKEMQQSLEKLKELRDSEVRTDA